VARVHRLEHVECFSASHFTHDDSVRAHSQSVSHQLSLGDLVCSFRRDGPGLKRHHVILLQLQL